MPQVNGNHYRSFGQGYAAEKGKSAKDNEVSGQEDKGGQEGQEGNGPMAHVKHEGGGKYKIKLINHDGSSEVRKAGSHEERKQILDEHFGADEGGTEDAEHGSEEYGDGDQGEGYGLKSILG